jgi:hypothetical protein
MPIFYYIGIFSIFVEIKKDMITDSKINKVQEKIKAAIAKIEREENVSISFGSIKYNSAYYATSMKVSTTEKNEKVNSIYESICTRLGFTQNVIGMTFQGTTGEMTITDIKTKNRKYPVIAQAQGGACYKYSVDHIKRLIGGDKIINRNANLDKLLGK